MNQPAYIYREKRLYNKWAASQTLEDYALRYTADSARRWSAGRVANTAIGATAFLACEAIGATITLAYGFANSVAAIAAAVALMFVIGFPIAYQAARRGLDIDLLTRGAGFGYLGSTITSLIYASFTFLLFSVEASIMAVALRAMSGIPMSLAYVLSSLVVIPVALYGMSAITRFQFVTQPIWVMLQLAPIGYILWLGQPALDEWSRFAGQFGAPDGEVSLLYFGLAFSTLLSLLPQIGEQADYLRFLPAREKTGRTRWWLAMIAGGPGWTLIGGAKLLLGSFLADYVLRHGATAAQAASPTDLFLTIFTAMTSHSGLALVLTGIFVITCQLKINVTNAYAGSIAWSNFFARLTHSHPGRVVWLIFNVVLALILMEIGILDAIEGILILYANIAAGWIGALAADLMISKPLGLSPRGIEFKRAHLFDINPVGVGAMTLSIVASTVSHVGLLGPLPQAFAPAIGLAIAFVAAPAIALATRSRYYIARRSTLPAKAERRCIICENSFQPDDMAHCPVYSAPICSLCCTLEARCHDRCKDRSRATEQVSHWLERLLPTSLAAQVHTPVGHFIGVLALINLCNALVLGVIHREFARRMADGGAAIAPVLLAVFFAFALLAGIAAWIIVLAHESRRAAMQETQHHMQKLVEEIASHDVTDRQLQKAKEAAESANAAKSRYLVSVSHEIRSPLNSIYGYAQLLERGSDVPPVEAARVIRRSAEHLTNLVEGLLDISQVESGILRVSRDTVRLPPFLDQLANMFRPQAQAKGIAFVYERPERLPEFVHTDQKRLRQILINVLSNAIKFTEAGKVGFKVKYRSQLATIEIADTGIGIDPRDLKRIFDPFERGSNPGAHRQQGVGLGLSITQALVQILGGEITVSSEPGKGTRFVIRVMLSQAAAGAALPDSPSGDTVTGYVGPRRSILLIDDDPTQIAVLRNLLEPLGFPVYTALDGESGTMLAAQVRPDLVLLDITMPGLSGWETARLIREAHGPAIRIVMVSADAHEYRRGGDGQDAHDMFLIKPVELNTLLDTISDQLDIEWTSGTPAPATADAGEGGSADALPEAAQAYLVELEQLVRIGHVRGIERKIQEFEAAVPEARPMTGHFLASLDRFDLKGLGAMIKTRLNDGR
ncbi:hybrid sensor histidine kinase/response regulator [Edaphosphingomonas haloaromaticamans]|uniref:histidine kinase n=1 Tax=Edaphosphingomonas haloaromaticamans TaxID=653954 RepID=A0A1S1HJ27_9SPHN|nr:ATP-binding protein [Sphingomonas haloaromaticamans]OHT21852.1 Autoinducer 2 sensor kinase/phosphatase LuxQ [Sphingomonas haloaromaticamans]